MRTFFSAPNSLRVETMQIAMGKGRRIRSVPFGYIYIQFNNLFSCASVNELVKEGI